MKEIIKFKEFVEFDFRCGEIKEIKKNKIIVDVNDLIICDKGNPKFNIGDKVIVLLKYSGEGRVLATYDDGKFVLLTVDKKINNGSRIS